MTTHPAPGRVGAATLPGVVQKHNFAMARRSTAGRAPKQDPQ